MCITGPSMRSRAVSVRVAEGEVVTLIGANGAGTTTLLRTISGLSAAGRARSASTARIFAALRPHEIVRLGLSHAPGREADLRQHERHGESELGAYLRRDPAGVKRDRDMCSGCFPAAQERERQGAATLLGGEQQMLAIGRALMSRRACCSWTSLRWAWHRCWCVTFLQDRPRDQSGGHDPCCWWSRMRNLALPERPPRIRLGNRNREVRRHCRSTVAQ